MKFIYEILIVIILNSNFDAMRNLNFFSSSELSSASLPSILNFECSAAARIRENFFLALSPPYHQRVMCAAA